MELSPQEQSFFDAGEALSGPGAAAAAVQAPRRRRHSRTMPAVLAVVAVVAGYWVSMQVINRDIPNAADFGIGLH
jgi:hypothetical protein